MKKGKNLIIMSTVLVLLVAVYLVWTLVGKTDTVDTEETSVTYPLPTIDPAALVGVELEIDASRGGAEEDTAEESTQTGETGETGETSKLTFTLSEDAKRWLWSEDGEVPLDNVAFASMVTAISGYASPHKLENVADADLGRYGLAQPYMSISFTFSDESQRQYKVGALNSFNGMYYFSDSSTPDTVYMVDSSVIDVFDVDIYDLLQYDTTPSISTTNFTKVTFITGGVERVYTYYPTGKADGYTDKYLWYLSVDGAEEVAVDASVAEKLTAALGSVSFEDCASLNYKTDESFAFGDDRLIIDYKKVEKVTDSTTGLEKEVTTPATYTLYLCSGEEGGELYAHTDGSALVYLLRDSADIATLRGGSLATIRPDELWLPNYELISSMGFSTADGSFDVKVNNKNGEITYSREDGELDSAAFLSALSELDALVASSNTEYLEGSGGEGTLVYFTLELELVSGELLVMTAESYTDSYARVTFNGRDDQLITAQSAEKLATTLSAFMK